MVPDFKNTRNGIWIHAVLAPTTYMDWFHLPSTSQIMPHGGLYHHENDVIHNYLKLLITLYSVNSLQK